MATGNIAEKVRKLLAKASSQNEHEAQAALLKARELMARYKLTEKDVKDADPASRELVKTFFEEVYFSNKVHVWLPRLADVVASNHCCGHFIATYGGEKRIIGFAGLGEDSVIAQDVFRYAVRFVLDRVKEKRKEINRDYYSQQHRNKLALIFEQNYAEGFLLGAERAIRRAGRGTDRGKPGLRRAGNGCPEGSKGLSGDAERRRRFPAQEVFARFGVDGGRFPGRPRLPAGQTDNRGGLRGMGLSSSPAHGMKKAKTAAGRKADGPIA